METGLPPAEHASVHALCQTRLLAVGQKCAEQRARAQSARAGAGSCAAGARGRLAGRW